ncbi:MAG: hypothetical protein KUL82_00465 [Bdellovibrio sp.]|nr:hypothetical protein [Bdellovibrio sp.]
MRFLIYILLPLIPIFARAQGASCVNMQLQVNQSVINLTSSQITANPQFVVKANTNPGGCDFFMTFDYGQGNSYNNRTLRRGSDVWPLQISKNSSGTEVLKNIQDVSSMNDVLSGTLSAGSNDRQVGVSYWVLLNMANPWLSAGLYQDTFVVHLYKGSPWGVYSLVESRSVGITFQAPKKADISLVPSGGSFNLNDTTEVLNFGELTEGSIRSCDAVLKYNAGYILKASSANEGRLKHQTMPEYISYQIRFNGSLFNLSGTASSPRQIFRELGRSPASGLSIPISVKVGSVSGKRSGSYQDVITLTVESAE